MHENRIMNSLTLLLQGGRGDKEKSGFDQGTLYTWWKYHNEIPLYNYHKLMHSFLLRLKSVCLTPPPYGKKRLLCPFFMFRPCLQTFELKPIPQITALYADAWSLTYFFPGPLPSACSVGLPLTSLTCSSLCGVWCRAVRALSTHADRQCRATNSIPSYFLPLHLGFWFF
jgi:hypothetical protein